MRTTTAAHPASPLGFRIQATSWGANRQARVRVLERLESLGLSHCVETQDAQPAAGGWLRFSLKPNLAQEWAPAANTQQLAGTLNLASRVDPQDLEREILLSLLLSPQQFDFPSFDEFEASVAMRVEIVLAARKTQLEFRTTTAERPENHWTYDPDRGFVLRPGQPLIEALVLATQPEVSGRLYSFSCSRATEYVVLLAMARAMEIHHPELLARLHQQAERRALKSYEFESSLIQKLGSATKPLPPQFFVPGDRTWFRNPDYASSDITGFEGSWTFYLGNGEFADFWRPGKTYTLTTKCLSIYFWRESTVRQDDGSLQVDEALVERKVQQVLRDPAETARLLRDALRCQEPMDVFEGGCVERTRDYPCFICPGTENLTLPDAPPAAQRAARREFAR